MNLSWPVTHILLLHMPGTEITPYHPRSLARIIGHPNILSSFKFLLLNYILKLAYSRVNFHKALWPWFREVLGIGGRKEKDGSDVNVFSFQFLRAMKRIWKRRKHPYTWNHRNSDCLHMTSTRLSNQNSSIDGSKVQDTPHFVEYLLVVVGSWGQRLLFYFRGRPVIGYLCSGACIGNIIQATEMQKKI